MNNIDPTQSAFAYAIPEDHFNYWPGLTKREYFIAAALQGLCANPQIAQERRNRYEIAVAAIEQADAVIQGLNEEQ